MDNKKYTRNKISTNLIFSVVIMVSTFMLCGSIRYLKDFDKSIEVKGVSERIVKSDYASWNIGYNVSGNNLKDIESQVSNKKNLILYSLKENGIKESEIQVGTISVTDNWANQYNSNFAQMAHYQITANMYINTSSIDNVNKASEGLNSLIKNGLILNTNNISYFFKDLNSLKNDMLLEATTNARNSAEAFAKNSNSKVRDIKKASQGLFTISSPDGNNINDTQNINKKVRVVTSIDYFIN